MLGELGAVPVVSDALSRSGRGGRGAADETLAAIDHGSRGVYNVVDDDPAPVAEWPPALAQELGAKTPMRVPK